MSTLGEDLQEKSLEVDTLQTEFQTLKDANSSKQTPATEVELQALSKASKKKEELLEAELKEVKF